MKVKFLESVVGKGIFFKGGEVYDLSPSQAYRYVKEGYAELLQEETRPLKVQEIKNVKKRPVKR